MFFVTSINVEGGYYSWDFVNTKTITSGMYHSSGHYDSWYAESYLANPDVPSNIRMGVSTTSFVGKADAWVMYDSSIMGIGGSYETIHTAYKAKVKWWIGGLFDDNGDIDTYLKFEYEMFYMEGSSKVPLGVSTYLFNDGVVNFDGYVYHTVYSDNYVSAGYKVYLHIKVKLSANGKLPESYLDTDFYEGANKFNLQTIKYYNWIYHSSPPGGIF